MRWQYLKKNLFRIPKVFCGVSAEEEAFIPSEKHVENIEICIDLETASEMCSDLGKNPGMCIDLKNYKRGVHLSKVATCQEKPDRP